jgi:hypothetical protein
MSKKPATNMPHAATAKKRKIDLAQALHLPVRCKTMTQGKPDA